MKQFMLGVFCSAFFLELMTYYGWTAKRWNDWLSMGFALSCIALFGASVFARTFIVMRRAARAPEAR